MAFAGTTIWEVQTGGDDTNFSGAFDPGQTAGMFTDGAATSATTAAPVFSSASYNFVAGDAGAWVYIASGTNWIPGWYNISSVSSNVATLNATAGSAALKPSPLTPSTVTGCATTGSPTGATWSIDYSQQAASRFTYTDLSSTGTGLTASSAAFPFGKQYVGNSIVVTGGTNFTMGRYVLASVAAGVGTFLGAANLHTAAGTDSDGAGRMGGCLASPGLPGGIVVGSNRIYIKAGTYSITSTTANISGGRYAPSSISNLWVEGYSSVRGDLGTKPVLQASGISTTTLFTASSDNATVNLEFDGANLTAIRGCSLSNGTGQRLMARNCKNSGIAASNSGLVISRCQATGCSTAGAGLLGNNGGTVWVDCEAYANTVNGITPASGDYFINCISYSNTGGTTNGFGSASRLLYLNCTSYGNGQDGFGVSTGSTAINCIAESNGRYGINNGVAAECISLVNFSSYLNSTAPTNGAFYQNINAIAGSGSFFVNAASGNFALNSTSGAGALLRGTGYPGVFPAGTTTGYLDIGAAQHQEVASGGETVAIFGG